MTRIFKKKNIHNGKKTKKLDGENGRTASNVTQRDAKYMVIFISATLERKWEKQWNNDELAAHIHKYQHHFDKDIEFMILKGNLYQKHKRELWYDILELNIEMKHYGRKLYEAITDLTK